MSKVFKAICKSFKGKHPEGTVIHEVYVKGEIIKDAIEAAKIELNFWDPENAAYYQAPKVSVVEDGQQALEAYMLKKEQHGQTEITDGEGTQQQTTNLFDEQTATVAEFAIAYPYAVRVAVALAKEKFLSSYSIVNTESNAVAVGFINSFNPKPFKEIDNAISFAIGNATDAINKHMSDVLAGADLASSVQMLKNYASDAESEFIDNYIDDIDLQSAQITEAVVEAKKLATSNKADDISIIADAVICHRDYKNCADPHEPEEFIGQVKANFKEILDEYGQLPGQPVAEHIQSMAEVRDLYNLGLCEEIAGLYITPQGNQLSAVAQDMLDKTAALSQENADKDWPKGEPVGYDSSNEWQRLAFSILSKTNEAGEPTPQQYKEIAAKLCGVFAEKGLELMSGEFYSEVATQLITHAINTDSVFATLLNLRELRKLVSDIMETPASSATSNEPTITHNPENEYECFIAEILSRIGDEGSSYLTGAQYEDAGAKLNTVILEFNDWHNGEREHNGKFLTFVKDKTLENIADIDFDDPNEVTKIFLNLNNLRAAIRENIELTESDKPASKAVKKTEIVSLKEMPTPHAFTENTNDTIGTWPCLRLLSLDIGDSLTAHMSIGRSLVEKNIEHNSFIGVIENRNGVFYAIKKSLDKPNVNNRLTNAVHGALSEIEKIINCKFGSAKDAIHTVNLWRENKVGDQWFMQHSSSFDVKATIIGKVATKELSNGNSEQNGGIDATNTGNNAPKQDQSLPKGTKSSPKTLPDEPEGLPGKQTSQADRPNSNIDSTTGNSDSNNPKPTGKAVEKAPNEKSSAPSVDSDPKRVSGDAASDPVLDSDEGDGPSLDIDNKVSELESQWSQDDQTKDNMRIWSQVHRTDRGITKQDHKGRKSIPIQYRIMKMTEVFGVYGFGWGYKILREWETEGAPIIINGEFTGEKEIIHHCEVELWVKINGEKSEPATHYGDTKQYYYSNGYNGKPGYFVNDDEVHKKSLSDALGKAMTMFGVCADVYLGEHDDAHIDTLNHNMAEAAKKVRHLEEEEKIRTEVNDQVVEIIEEMQETTTKAGVNTLRAKALHAISGLPDISDEQKRKKSSVIQKLEIRYNERLQEIVSEQERKKQEKAEKAKQPDKETAEPEKQEA